MTGNSLHNLISSNLTSQVPSPRPGTCINDTRSLPDANINFIRNHVLMDDPVPPFFGAPVVVRTGLISRFTVVAVDPQVKTTDGKTYDVIFVGQSHIRESTSAHVAISRSLIRLFDLGTTNGRVIKCINSRAGDSRFGVSTVVIEELQVYSSSTKIKDIKVIRGGSRRSGGSLKSLGRLVVMSDEELRSFPVQRCERASSCAECVALQDPYCAWDIRSAR